MMNRFQVAALKGGLLMMQMMACVGLQSDFYKKRCPNVDFYHFCGASSTAFPRLFRSGTLRLAFLLCNTFLLQGCDGSVLIDSSRGNKAEKDGPATVSCADILALAARDAVVLAGGPEWEVPLGRKDGKISRATDTTALPAPTFNISQLLQSFPQEDSQHMTSWHSQKRIHSFSSTEDVDPSLHPSFAESLKKACPAGSTQKNAGALLDSTATRFDNQYYKDVVAGKGLFSSDAALYTDEGTKQVAHQHAASRLLFYRDFVKSMVKMSSIPGQGSQEVRLNCRKFN